MKINLLYRVLRHSYFFLVAISFCMFIFVRANPLYANPPLFSMKSENKVVEHLRLKVTSTNKDAWLKAEKATWEPWLERQNGFIGRDLFWDPKEEEATVLISWESKKKWKSISQAEIEFVQNQFESIAIDEIGNEFSTPPFPITFEGELLPQ